MRVRNDCTYILFKKYCQQNLCAKQFLAFSKKNECSHNYDFLFIGYSKYDFWTSGNNLGTDMYLWMSTGLPFNATFNYMRKLPTEAPIPRVDDSMDPLDVSQGSTAPQRTARHGYVYTFIYMGMWYLHLFFVEIYLKFSITKILTQLQQKNLH